MQIKNKGEWSWEGWSLPGVNKPQMPLEGGKGKQDNRWFIGSEEGNGSGGEEGNLSCDVKSDHQKNRGRRNRVPTGSLRRKRKEKSVSRPQRQKKGGRPS